jgi:hypothetical protein
LYKREKNKLTNFLSKNRNNKNPSDGIRMTKCQKHVVDIYIFK